MPSGYKKKDEFKNCLDVLEALIEEIPMTNSIVLIGDFNIDLFKASYKEDIRSISLRKMMKKYQLYALSSNESPTYRGHTGHASHIDLVITNNLGLICNETKTAAIMDFVPWNTSTHTALTVEVNESKTVRHKKEKTVIKKKNSSMEYTKYKYI